MNKNKITMMQDALRTLGELDALTFTAAYDIGCEIIVEQEKEAARRELPEEYKCLADHYDFRGGHWERSAKKLINYVLKNNNDLFRSICEIMEKHYDAVNDRRWELRMMQTPDIIETVTE